MGAYPNYPDQRLIVGGVDLTKKFKMILADGYVLNPPEPKTYSVDIPGGNGKLDLTESLLGDTSYNNRKQEFEFYVIDPESFEATKTAVRNFLHGKSYDYQLTMDPGYTYTGRFKVESYSHKQYTIGQVGLIKISVDAKPFKRYADKIYRINAIGGITVYLESGRKSVRPVVECDGPLKVIHNGKLTTLPQGTWTLNDVVLKYGVNPIYFNSFDVHSFTWKDFTNNSITWGDFKKQPLYKWYNLNGLKTSVIKKWSDVASNTWESLSDSKWSDLIYQVDTSSEIKDIKDVYVKYEWGDL